MIGRQILHYKVLAKLGEGGMGIVYKAEDTKLKREVAVKFLPRQIAAREEDRERFKIEAQAAGALNHPNIATIYAIEEVDGPSGDGEMFIVMEYIEGQELGEIVGATGPLDPSDAINYAIQIAQGLQAAHKKGIIHRDIKSRNIMITEGSQVKIMDFGLAKVLGGAQLTQADITLGTAAYMSPEQSSGKDVDQRTDIWAFGVVLYEMLTGERPFQGHYEQAVIYAIVNEDPKIVSDLNPKVPAELAAVVTKALQKEPADRYPNMGGLIADLKKSMTGPATQISISAQEEKQDLALAVLPFADLSPQKDQEYFCDGMTEELLDALAKVAGWRVVSRTSVFAFKGKKQDIRTIGEQLRVSHALEGSVRKAGNRLRITAQLINVDDGFQLWSEKYDRELDDVFAIQDDIARMIVDKLRLEVANTDEETLVKHYTQNLEAYNLYLQARFHLNKRTEEGSKSGIRYCQQAIALDPEYALAYAALSDCYIILGFQGFLAPKEAIPRAKNAAEKALALDSSFAEVHTSLACILAVYDRDWTESKKAFRRALELNPNSATAHYWYALWYLLPNGQFDSSQAEIKKAQKLDPLSQVLNTGIGWQFYFARQYDRAIEALKEVLELDKDYVFAHDILGQVYEQKGVLEEAIAESEKAAALAGRRTLSLGTLGHVYATAGKLQEANNVLEEFKELSKQKYVSAYDVALVYAGLGDADHALEYLEKAYDEHNGWLNFLNVEPRFDDLRSDPRFTTLVKKVGLHCESQ